MIDVSRRFSDNLTEQEAFNIAASRLALMTRRSVNSEDVCTYRQFDAIGNVTNCCVAGYFLKDEEYRSDMEEDRWKTVAPKRLRDTVPLLNEIQKIHDDQYCWGDKSKMKDRLCSLAGQYNLDGSILYQVKWVPGQA